NIVGARKIVRLGRAQKAKAVRQNFDDAFADNVDFLLRQLLENGEHELLLAHGGGIFHLVLFSEGKQFRGGFDLEVLEFHFPHSWGSWEKIASAESNRRSQRRRPQVLGVAKQGPGPMPLPVLTDRSKRYICLRSGRLRKDMGRPLRAQGAGPTAHRLVS